MMDFARSRAQPISSLLAGGVSLVAALVLCGCAHHVLNKPLAAYNPAMEDRDIVAPVPARLSDLNFFVAFSGGGTRAAAMAYGTLEALESVQLPTNPAHPEAHTLLDEVDYITSVSGGSFTGAYYALFGKRIFDDFRQKFLYQPVTRAIAYRLMNPVNWVRLASGDFNRADLAAEYYDHILFEGKTFADIIPPERGPVFQPEATDIEEGCWFGFSEFQFAVIGSDLQSYPITRAVTASSAFPGGFPAITLKNYAGQGGFKLAPWMEEALSDGDISVRGYTVARRIKAYQDTNQIQYIHLMDGGITDNLGMQAPMEHAIYGSKQALNNPGKVPRRSVMIVVNAQTSNQRKGDHGPHAPRVARVLGALTKIMISNGNFATVSFMRTCYEAVKRQMDAQGKPYDYYLIEISLDQVPDPELREHLTHIPTSFGLKQDDVDALRKATRDILYRSDAFQSLVKDLGGTFPGGTPP